MNWIIRDERKDDIDAIAEVTRVAFENHPYGHNTEQFIIRALREAGALTLSLVAESKGRVVGHVAFSSVSVSDGSRGWYGVGPISVLPGLQRKGIGQSLIREGLARLRAAEARGCVLVGDPGYYVRFGFRSDPGLIHEGVPQEFVLALSLDGSRAQGTVTFHPAFFVMS